MSTFKTRKREVRYAVVSDIHLGNQRNPAARIIANLKKYVTNTAFLSTLDILFFAGDVFDEMLYLSAYEVGEIQVWIGSVLANCRRLGIKLRVLEGTPSHDRKQSKLFVDLDQIQMQDIRNSGHAPLDLKYVDVLDVEYMEDLDLSILYIPDEWGASTDDAYQQALAKMQEKGMEYVDIAIMHGLFPHQLPVDIPHIPRHNDQLYLKIVRYIITIGHIHTFSVYERIIAQGSFDRLSQNEEEPKGFVVVNLTTGDDYTAEFVENEGALIFKTLSVTDMDMVESLIYLEEKVATIPPGSHLRIEATSTHSVSSNMAVIRHKWPDYTWTYIGRDKSKKEKKALVDKQRSYVPLVLDRLTLGDIMLGRVMTKSIPSPQLRLCAEILKEVIK